MSISIELMNRKIPTWSKIESVKGPPICNIVDILCSHIKQKNMNESYDGIIIFSFVIMFMILVIALIKEEELYDSKISHEDTLSLVSYLFNIILRCILISMSTIFTVLNTKVFHEIELTSRNNVLIKGLNIDPLLMEEQVTLKNTREAFQLLIIINVIGSLTILVISMLVTLGHLNLTLILDILLFGTYIMVSFYVYILLYYIHHKYPALFKVNDVNMFYPLSILTVISCIIIVLQAYGVYTLLSVM